MNSVYYCFLCDAESKTSEEWNAHLNVSFSIFLNEIDFFSTFSTFFKLTFIFSVLTFSSYFFHIYSSWLRCLVMFWYDMFESVQDM